MAKKSMTIIALSVAMILTIGMQLAFSEVRVYNSKDQFVGELIGIKSVSEWFIFNPELDRLILMSSNSGRILPPDVNPCPHFVVNNCTGQAYLNANLRGWITICNDRLFTAVGEELIDLSNPHELKDNGNCDYFPEVSYGFTSDELTSQDIPFDFLSGAGPLRMEHYSGGGNVILPAVQKLPAPAITPNGIILLSGLLGGVGYLAIRRRK